MKYAELSQLDPRLLQAISELGYETLTPIQEKAIPAVLQGRDVMGAAQTGTGKTAAFSLPILHRLLPLANSSASPARHPVRALILTPTRELADQVAASIKAYARHTNLRSTVVFGGVDIGPQAQELRAGVEILVATPGRLLDHIESKNTSLNSVEYVVLDEADRMLDIGFLPDLNRILGYLPKVRTTLLFSATFSSEIRTLAKSFLQNPLVVEVAKANATSSLVRQVIHRCPTTKKYPALATVLQEYDVGQAMVFVNTKIGAARLARSLQRDGYLANALHGDKSQAERLATLDAFKGGQVKLLVATDVAARGLDIAEMPVVINFDLPYNAEDYVHRIGRTGRAGSSGLAVSLVGEEDGRYLTDIERLTQQKFEELELSLTQRPRTVPKAPKPALAGNDGLSKEPYRSPTQREAVSNQSRPLARRVAAGKGHRPEETSPIPDPIFNKPYVPSVQEESSNLQRQTIETQNTRGAYLTRAKGHRKVPSLLQRREK